MVEKTFKGMFNRAVAAPGIRSFEHFCQAQAPQRLQRSWPCPEHRAFKKIKGIISNRAPHARCNGLRQRTVFSQQVSWCRAVGNHMETAGSNNPDFRIILK